MLQDGPTEREKAAQLLEDARQALLIGEPVVCLKVLHAMGRNSDWLEEQELFEAITLGAAAASIIANREIPEE